MSRNGKPRSLTRVQMLAGMFDVIERSITLTVDNTQVAADNPLRVSIWFSAAAGSNISVSTLNNGVLGSGFSVANVGAPLRLHFARDGAAVCRAWYTTQNSFPAVINVLEVVYHEDWARVP